MIGLSTVDYDAHGALLYKGYQQTNLYKNKRRYQRVATLDGGVAFELRGLFDADREFTLTLPFSDELADLLPNHSHWNVSSIDGFYPVFVADWNMADGTLVIEVKGI